MFSGLVTTAASMPVDIAKTRIQSQKYIDGKPEYKGAIDVILKVVRNEGVTSLWKGFTPYYFRLGPHTVLTFIFLEQMNKQYKIQVLGIKDAKGGGLWFNEKREIIGKGSFFNYLDQILPIIDHLQPPVDIFEGIPLPF